MKLSATGPIAALGDPTLEAARRWTVCDGLGLPIASWLIAGHDCADLEELLGADGTRTASEVSRDPEIMKIVRAAEPTGDPADTLAALRQLAAEREPPPEPEPVRVDRSDPLAGVALEVAAFDEPSAVALLADGEARALLSWLGSRLAPAHRLRLGSITRAMAGRPGAVAVLRARAVELLVDLELAAEERAERERLEAPGRAAAARLAARADALRAQLAAELDR